MPLFTYTDNTPDATQPPKISPANFVNNFTHIDGLLAVDHVSFNTANGGTHTQVTLNAPIADPVPTIPTEVIYSKLGTADVTKSQLFMANSAVNYFLSAIKAWAFCSGTAGGILSSQSYNVTSVIRTTGGDYDVTMPAGVVASANYGVLISCSERASMAGRGILGFYSSQTNTTFHIRTIDANLGSVADPISFSFVVIQI